jgi:hypothetical protein
MNSCVTLKEIWGRYGWSDGGGLGADPIVLTIPPGDFVSVGLTGSSLSPVQLNRGDSVNGEPCGTLFQDALQGLLSGDGGSGARIKLLPSAIPSSG